MLPEKLLVDSRFIIKAFEVSCGHELDEVFVSGLVPGQKNEVVGAFLVLARGAGFFEPRPRRYIHFAADDGLDAGLRGLEVKIEGAEKVAVVRDSDSGHAEINGFFDQAIERAGPVKEAVFGVEVKVDEIGVVHNGKGSSKFQSVRNFSIWNRLVFGISDFEIVPARRENWRRRSDLNR